MASRAKWQKNRIQVFAVNSDLLYAHVVFSRKLDRIDLPNTALDGIIHWIILRGVCDQRFAFARSTFLSAIRLSILIQYTNTRNTLNSKSSTCDIYTKRSGSSGLLSALRNRLLGSIVVVLFVIVIVTVIIVVVVN